MKLLPALLMTITAAAAANDATGYWKGHIESPNGRIPIMVELNGPNEKPTGTIDIPAQGLRAFALAGVEFADGNVQFTMDGVPGTPHFTGELDESGEAIEGTMQQGPYEIPFTLKRAERAISDEETDAFEIDPVPGEGVEGEWRGILQAGPANLRLVLHLRFDDNEALTAEWKSIDQDAVIPVNRAAYKEDSIELHMSSIQAAFKGTLNDIGDAIQGNWEQSGRKLPLTLYRAKNKADADSDN